MELKDVASMKKQKTDIFESIWLSDVQPTVESRVPTFSKNSIVCIPLQRCFLLQSMTPQCASHQGVKLRSVLPTAESSSVVCITQRSQTAHRKVKIKIFGSFWLLLKGDQYYFYNTVFYNIFF